MIFIMFHSPRVRGPGFRRMWSGIYLADVVHRARVEDGVHEFRLRPQHARQHRSVLADPHDVGTRLLVPVLSGVRHAVGLA